MKSTKAPPTPSAKQRQVLKALRDVPGARVEYDYAHQAAWLAPGDDPERLLLATCEILLSHNWIEIRRPGSIQDGQVIYVISEAGLEALR
jgi:hypothetical protein